MTSVDSLLAGPRGRYLCAMVARVVHEAVGEAFFEASYQPTAEAVARFGELLTAVDPTKVAAVDEPTLLHCLADAVTNARYWQEPDEGDRLLSKPEITGKLGHIAKAVLASEAVMWWTSPLESDCQAYVQWTDSGVGPPRLIGLAQALLEWRAAAIAEEQRAQRRSTDPAAAWSGSWWSTPAMSGVPITSRSLPYMGATELVLIEDGQGWERARIWPLWPAESSRVFEISGPEAWTALVAAYPLRVTRSRWHDWWRTTGRAGEWLMPDWAAVAADYDAVHLTVFGYLTVAGQALNVAGGATVLAGWAPDATFWLNDVLRQAGPPRTWQLHRDDQGDIEWQLE